VRWLQAPVGRVFCPRRNSRLGIDRTISSWCPSIARLGTAFRDQAVEPFLRGAQRAIARRFPHDPVAVFAAQTGSVGFAGISFISHDPARLRVLEHGFKLGLSA
jgi:hypothetical protein